MKLVPKSKHLILGNTLLGSSQKKQSSTFTKAPMSVIRGINECLIGDNEKLVSLNKETHELEYQFLVASNQDLRERAYRLAYTQYREHNLIPSDPSGMVTSPWDSGPDVFTVLAQNNRGEDVGTVSLVFDSKKGLPCSDIYRPELGTLRDDGRRLAEVTRLVVKPNIPHAREMLVHLFNLIYIYAMRIRSYSDFVIEVNPRHIEYYEKKLLFKAIGGVKKCPRVENAPATFAHVELSVIRGEIKRVGGMAMRGEHSAEKTIYPNTWPFKSEPLIAEHLYREYAPMTDQEKKYFGFPAKVTAENISEGNGKK